MKNLLISITFLFLSTIAFSQINKNYHVTSRILNLRELPSSSSKLIKQLKLYDNLIVINDTVKVGWYKVKFRTFKGFVASKYIKSGRSVVSSYNVRTGAKCRDGSDSYATGRGACSHHGGVSYWKTATRKTVRIIKD